MKYRIVEDGNGDLIAQKQISTNNEWSDDEGWKWVFFIDLEECDGDLEKAERKLKRTIMGAKQKILRYYDDDGDRID